MTEYCDECHCINPGFTIRSDDMQDPVYVCKNCGMDGSRKLSDRHLTNEQVEAILSGGDDWPGPEAS